MGHNRYEANREKLRLAAECRNPEEFLRFVRICGLDEDEICRGFGDPGMELYERALADEMAPSHLRKPKRKGKRETKKVESISEERFYNILDGYGIRTDSSIPLEELATQTTQRELEDRLEFNDRGTSHRSSEATKALHLLDQGGYDVGKISRNYWLVVLKTAYKILHKNAPPKN